MPSTVLCARDTTVNKTDKNSAFIKFILRGKKKTKYMSKKYSVGQKIMLWRKIKQGRKTGGVLGGRQLCSFQWNGQGKAY